MERASSLVPQIVSTIYKPKQRGSPKLLSPSLKLNTMPSLPHSISPSSYFFSFRLNTRLYGKTFHPGYKVLSQILPNPNKTMKSKKYSYRQNLSGKVSGIYIVFHTKYNRPLLKDSIQSRAKEIIRETLEYLQCGVVQIKVYPNRVHLQFVYPPRLSISYIMNKVKGKSSRLLRREFPELTKQCEKALWAPKFGMIY